MTNAGVNPSRVEGITVVIGIAGAAIAAAIFVALTVATGATYHLFPLLIGFVPGGLPRLLSERPLTQHEGTISTVAGLVAIGVAWLALVTLDEMPAATLISDQPGGVPGEFVLFGLLGAILGGWWGSRPA